MAANGQIRAYVITYWDRAFLYNTVYVNPVHIGEYVGSVEFVPYGNGLIVRVRHFNGVIRDYDADGHFLNQYGFEEAPSYGIKPLGLSEKKLEKASGAYGSLKHDKVAW